MPLTCYRCRREYRDGACGCADGITLFHSDCREILPLLPAGSGVSIVTDPQYGIEADKAKSHSSIRDNPRWPNHCWDTQRPDKSVFDMFFRFDEVAIWGGNYFADLLPASPAWLAWIKPEAETGFSLADMELCWTNKSFAARVRRFSRRDGHLHPTQKPLAVMKWTLEYIDAPSIVDPFAGSGTTAVACKLNGRKCVAIELEEKYVETAARRLDQGVLAFGD